MKAASREKAFYIPSVDGIRAIAFLLVFFFHALPMVRVPGMLGVTIFFFLSGYLITTLTQLEVKRTSAFSLRDFYIRRTLRILPPLYIVFLLAALLGSVGVLSSPGNFAGFLSLALYFFNYASVVAGQHFIVPQGLHVLWSVMVEEHYYLLFPFTYAFFLRRQISAQTQARWLAGICALAVAWRFFAAAVLHLDQVGDGGWMLYTTDCRFDSILWGALLAIQRNPKFHPASNRRRDGTLAALGLMLLLADCIIRNELFRASLRFTFDCLALYPIFFFAVRYPEHWSTRWLQWYPVRYVGWISFTLYLVHDCVLMRLGEWRGMRVVSNTIIAFAISFAIAWLMRHVVEEPLHRLRARFRGKMAPTAVVSEGMAGTRTA